MQFEYFFPSPLTIMIVYNVVAAFCTLIFQLRALKEVEVSFETQSHLLNRELLASSTYMFSGKP